MARRKRKRSSRHRQRDAESIAKLSGKITLRLPKSMVAFTTIILLFAVSWIPIRWGVADIYAYQARYQWQKWKQGEANATLTLPYWLAARDYLRRAIRLDPSNPELLEMMGILYEEKGRRSPGLERDRNPFLVESIRYFEQSLKLRPGSAMTWANLALVHYQSGQHEGPFRHALHRAVSLGPWEPGVLDIVSDVGLGAWPKLRPESKKLVTENIKRQAMSREQQLWLSVQAHQQTDLVCGVMSIKPLLEKYCPSGFSHKNEEIKDEKETSNEQEALPPIELEFKGVME